MRSEIEIELEHCSNAYDDLVETLILLEDALLECQIGSHGDSVNILASPMEEGYYQIQQALENARYRKNDPS